MGQRMSLQAAVVDQGWRFLLGSFRASVAVDSLAEAVSVAGRVVAACGDDADQHLQVDLRPDRVILTLRSAADRGVELAHLITEAGLRTEPGTVQTLEVGIDALDIDAVRPFWRAILGYEGDDTLVDPAGQGPAIWFQQMDAPRPQRNRLHFDVCVPHDAADARVASALAAGGHLVSDQRAPAFWVLADAEGNEACVTTWQGRD